MIFNDFFSQDISETNRKLYTVNDFSTKECHQKIFEIDSRLMSMSSYSTKLIPRNEVKIYADSR